MATLAQSPSLGVTLDLSDPFYYGSGATDEVPHIFPTAIAGHGYFIDEEQYQRRTLPRQRPDISDAGEPGETTLNPEGYWRRSQTRWDLGAGQAIFDDHTVDLESSRRRFGTSRGVDVFTDPHGVQLLHDTELKLSSANTNLQLLSFPTRLYILDGDRLRFTTDPTATTPTFTAITLPATATNMATDGSNIYIAYAAGHVLQIHAITTSTVADFGAENPELIFFASGRLLGTEDNTIYELDNAGAKIGTDIWTYPLGVSTAVTVPAITGTPIGIFFAANFNNRTEFYFTTADDTAGDLLAPTFAGALPDGELCYAMTFYGKNLLLGTSRGVRAAIVQASDVAAGTLDIQPFIEILGGAVRCFEPEGEAAWFGWSNYDDGFANIQSGLGRAQLNRNTSEDSYVPAYATDLMAAGTTGTVTSVVTWGVRRYFTVSGAGLYGENANLVTSGYFQTGFIRMGALVPKAFSGVEVGHDSLAGSITVQVEDVAGNANTLGTSNVAGSQESHLFNVGVRSRAALLTFILLRDTVTTTGPTLRFWVLNALPAPETVDEITLPVLMSTVVIDDMGNEHAFEPLEEFHFLQGLARSGEIVTHQDGDNSELVQVTQVLVDSEEFRRRVHDHGFAGQTPLWRQGTIYVKMLTVEGT